MNVVMLIMNANPKVSVVAITYNQEKFVRETIESVVSQDYPNIEYIISDDGSTDFTQEIIREYQEKYPDLITALTGNDNVGITRNINRGLAVCNGDFIALQGGDDPFLPGKIRAQVEWFQKSSSRVLCGHLLKVCDENSVIVTNHPTRKIKGIGPNSWIKKGALYGATSVMIRATSLPSHGFDTRMSIVSDWKLYIDSIGPKDHFGYINKYLAVYRRHGSNVTLDNERCLADIEKTFRILRADKKYPDNILNKGYAYNFLYGKGCIASKAGQHKEACLLFMKALKIDPFLWKSYLRIIQTIIRFLKSKLLNSD